PLGRVEDRPQRGDGDGEPGAGPGRVLVGPQEVKDHLAGHMPSPPGDEHLQQVARLAGLPVGGGDRLANALDGEASEDAAGAGRSRWARAAALASAARTAATSAVPARRAASAAASSASGRARDVSATARSAMPSAASGSVAATTSDRPARAGTRP